MLSLSPATARSKKPNRHRDGGLRGSTLVHAVSRFAVLHLVVPLTPASGTVYWPMVAFGVRLGGGFGYECDAGVPAVLPSLVVAATRLLVLVSAFIQLFGRDPVCRINASMSLRLFNALSAHSRLRAEVASS